MRLGHHSGRAQEGREAGGGEGGIGRRGAARRGAAARGPRAGCAGNPAPREVSFVWGRARAHTGGVPRPTLFLGARRRARPTRQNAPGGSVRMETPEPAREPTQGSGVAVGCWLGLASPPSPFLSRLIPCSTRCWHPASRRRSLEHAATMGAAVGTTPSLACLASDAPPGEGDLKHRLAAPRGEVGTEGVCGWLAAGEHSARHNRGYARVPVSARKGVTGDGQPPLEAAMPQSRRPRPARSAADSALGNSVVAIG
jgi:hypothetical protein